MAKRSKQKRNRAAVAAPAAGERGISKPWRERDWLWVALLAGAVVLAYVPVWWAGYIWDDDTVISNNPAVTGLGGLKLIWTGKAADICPLTLSTFWLEYRLWGAAALPYHLVNVMFHLFSAILLWRVLRALEIPGAWFGAALWAVHPVMVESVAWATELKNTESAFFYLLSIWFFIRVVKAASFVFNRNYALTLLFAAMAIACKSSTVILPFVLLLVAWWLERGWSWRRLAQVSPIFLFSIASGLLAMWTQKAEGVQAAVLQRSWPERIACAGDAAWFYLGKLLRPYPLEMTYPKWQIDTTSLLAYLPLFALAVVLSIFWLKRGSWARPWFFAWAYFLVTLLPVIGLVNMKYFSYTLVADHFQYLAAMGPLALSAAGAVRWLESLAPGETHMRATLAATVLAVLGILTWQKANVYRDEETLWTDTLAHNPQAWIGYNNIGMAYVRAHRQGDAIPLFRKSLAVNQSFAFAWNNLGASLCSVGDIADGIDAYQSALKVDPENTASMTNLGVAYSKSGRFDDAIATFNRALKIDPTNAAAWTSLGMAYIQSQKPADAVAPLMKVVEIHPDDPSAHNDLGGALYQSGRLDQALMQFREAVRLDPNYADARKNLDAAQADRAQAFGHVPGQ